MLRVFIGPNSYALKQAVKELRAEFIKKHGELSVEIIDGDQAGFEELLQAVESVPFLADKKLVIAYDLSSIKEVSEKIEEIAEKAESGNELLIVESKIDKRGVYYKYLKKNAELTEFKELDDRGLVNWLISQAKLKNMDFKYADANYLIQRIGVNQELAANELAKLLDYGKPLSKETIDLMTDASPQTNVFNLLDSVFGGNAEKALRIYDEQRIQGDEPLKIFGMLVWQMHLIAMVDAAGDRSDQEIMDISGLKPFTLNKTRSIAHHMGRERIRAALDKLVKLDKQMKTTSVDADDALKNLLMTIS